MRGGETGLLRSLPKLVSIKIQNLDLSKLTLELENQQWGAFRGVRDATAWFQSTLRPFLDHQSLAKASKRLLITLLHLHYLYR